MTEDRYSHPDVTGLTAADKLAMTIEDSKAAEARTAEFLEKARGLEAPTIQPLKGAPTPSQGTSNKA